MYYVFISKYSRYYSFDVPKNKRNFIYCALLMSDKINYLL